MKPQDLDLADWQRYLNRFKKEADEVKSPILPVAMRIENTQLTIARHTGGIKYNGCSYTYFEPKIPGHAPNPDGTPYVAWLLVREDFLKWVTRTLRQEQKAAKAAKSRREPDLLAGVFN